MNRRWFWILLPAVLIAAMQATTIPLIARRLDIDALISFQAMLSTWPWLGMMSLGLEKQARELAVESGGLPAFLAVWTNVIVIALVVGCATGLWGGFVFGNPLSWIVFCAFSAISGAMSPARDLFFARGQAAWIGKVHATGLAASLVGLAICLVAPISLVVVALVWAVPQCVVWIYVCREARFRPGPPARPGVTLLALRAAYPFALQGAGFIALSSFDVLILRGHLDDRSLLDYILATRTVALAFLFSGAVGNTLIHRTIGIGHQTWIRLLLTSFGVHAAASLTTALAFCLLGEAIFGWLIPGVAFHFANGAVLLALCLLAIGRSLSEAALQMTGRARTHRVAAIVFLLSVAGVLQLFVWPSTDTVGALGRIAFGWALPAIYLLSLCFANARR